MTNEKRSQSYTCPMHPEVQRDEPGTCPKCGMNLVLQGAAEGYKHNYNKPRRNRKALWTIVIIAIFILLVIADVLGESLIPAALSALGLSFMMFWDILWALILGFGISAVVQAVVPKAQVARTLPDSSIGSLAKACGLGAASSSCSYAAVAIARSLFRKGADFTAAMAFEFASTNLVLELGIILWVLLGWQFTLAEFLGGIIMVAILATLFKLFLSKKLLEEARAQSEKGIRGAMEGHAEMDMSLKEGTVWQKLFSGKGYSAISNFFFMDVYSVWKDIAVGLLIAGALGAWVPASFWRSFFLTNQSGTVQTIWGAFIGPLVSMISFVCSVGNVPLAAVLWGGGISFAGVISFIFADLIIFPILNIYRKYYGLKMSAFLFATSYASMAITGIIIQYIFSFFGLVPTNRNIATLIAPTITLNYTTVLNIIFLILFVPLFVRFMRTKGLAMLKMMR